MRFLPLLLSALLLSGARATETDDFQELSLDHGDQPVRYRLLPPERIVDGTQYPLVLFLHGLGERGSDNRSQLRHFPEKMGRSELRKKYPCFLLAPQCAGDDVWVGGDWRERRVNSLTGPATRSMDRVIAILRETLRTQPIDPARIYLTGLSMGGFGSWDLAMRYPEWFAAVAPVCGGGDTRFAHRLLDTPVFAWHGARDEIVPPEFSRVMIGRLKELGGDPRYEELEGVGHNAWDDAYGEDGALDWLFRQSMPEGYQRTPGLRALASDQSPVKDDARIAFFGDSITQAGAEPGGYANLIAAAVADHAPGAEVIYAGISGNKVTDLAARLDRDVLAHDPTLVFVYIGINDVWHSLNGRGTDPDTYRETLRKVLLDITDHGARCILATPSLIGELPDGANELDEKLDQYAAISRSVADEVGVSICDLRRAMTASAGIFNRGGGDRGFLTSDGVHLNPAGNRFVADHAARHIFEVLSP